MPTHFPRLPSQPWRLTQIRQNTADEAAGALLDLACALNGAHVRNGTLWDECKSAVQRNALDLVPSRVFQALVQEAKNEVRTESRKVQALHRDNDQTDKENRPLMAVTALVQATFCHFRYDVDQVELDATLSATLHSPNPVRVTIGLAATEREAQRAVLRYTGPLASFAERAHPNAKAKHVFQAMGDLVKSADLRVSQDADSQPVALVQAILSHRIYRSNVDGQGRYAITLRTQPALYGAEGIGVDDQILYVVPAAIAGVLQPMSFRHKSAVEIGKMLRRAPGFVNATKDGTTYTTRTKDEFKTKRTVAVHLPTFFAAIDASTGTPAGDVPLVPTPDDDGRDPIALEPPAFDAPFGDERDAPAPSAARPSDALLRLPGVR